MRRAIRDEEKERRRQTIVDEAWRQFQNQPYEAVNVAGVAAGVGLAKGTIYLYFPTKEALFLAVQQQQVEGWFDAIDARLAALPGGAGVTKTATELAESLGQRPSLVRLLAILHVVLERNIDYEDARAFKQRLLARLTHTGRQLEAALPFLTAGQGAVVLLQAYALAIGLQHLAEPAPIVRQVLNAEPALDLFDIDFAPALAAAFATLLRGHESESRS